MDEETFKEDICAVIGGLVAAISVIGASRYRKTRSVVPSRRKIDRRTIPFEGIKRIINPGGPIFALHAAQIYLDADNEAFEYLFRMSKPCFYALEGWYACHTDLKGSKYQSRAQKLLIFLWTLVFDEPQRNTAAKFHIAQSSVSSVIETCLTETMKLAKALITIPEPSFVSPKIELDPKNCQFNGCIGAIDGTHIPIFVPASQKERFIGRKGQTQNVFAAVCPAGRIQFVLAGADGRMADVTLLENAIAQGFDVPPGRFYIADAGFGLRKGILIPYAGQRFHLDEFKQSDRRPQISSREAEVEDYPTLGAAV